MGDYSTQMGTAILQGIGAPLTPENYKLLAAWAQAEGGSASYNAFNTTLPKPGSTNYNSFGPDGRYHVQSYPDYATGVSATVATLQQSNMSAIRSALVSGTSANVTAAAIGASGWGTSAANLEKIVGEGPSAVPSSTSGADTGTVAETADEAGTKDCYLNINLGVGSVCVDDVVWIALGVIATGATLLGLALVALGSGHSHPAARAIVSTLGPTAVASKAVKAAKAGSPKAKPEAPAAPAAPAAEAAA